MSGRRHTTQRTTWLVSVGVATTLSWVLAGCTHDSDVASPATTHSASLTPSTPLPQPDASTAPAVTLTQRNARLVASIEQLGGGVPASKRPAIRQAIAKPIEAWVTNAYLASTYPTNRFPDAFAGWTNDAAVEATRDDEITTNAVIGSQLVAVVADRQRAKLYVFATQHVTGGATAKVRLLLTAERLDGSLVRYAIWGDLDLTRDGGRWHIFGYDLQRAVLP